jgi:hypothetical protein
MIIEIIRVEVFTTEPITILQGTIVRLGIFLHIIGGVGKI